MITRHDLSHRPPPHPRQPLGQRRNRKTVRRVWPPLDRQSPGQGEPQPCRAVGDEPGGGHQHPLGQARPAGGEVAERPGFPR